MTLTPEQIEKLEAFLVRADAVGVKAAGAEIGLIPSVSYAVLAFFRKALGLPKLSGLRKSAPRRISTAEVREYLAMKAAQQAGPST